MSSESLKERINQAQGDYLELLYKVVLIFVFIYYGRNFVRFGLDLPDWHLATSAFVIVATALISLLIAVRQVPARFYQAAGMLLALLHGVATLSNILASLGTGTYAAAVSVIGFSICVLSLRYFIGGLSLFLAAWLVAVTSVQDSSQWLPTAGLIAISVLVSIIIFRERLAAVAGLLRLETRVVELESYLSLCASCKKVRDNQDNWQSLENYLESDQNLKVTHGICPSCKETLYGELLAKRVSA